MKNIIIRRNFRRERLLKIKLLRFARSAKVKSCFQTTELSANVPKFNLSQFLNILFNKLVSLRDSKTYSSLIVKNVLSELKKTNNTSGIRLFNLFMNRASLRFALRPYVTRGKIMQMPKPTTREKSRYTLLKTFVESSKKRNEKTLALRFSSEINDFFKNNGIIYNNRIDAYDIAKQNRFQAKFLYRKKKFKKKSNVIKKNKFSLI